jgi:hypothetical protein
MDLILNKKGGSHHLVLKPPNTSDNDHIYIPLPVPGNTRNLNFVQWSVAYDNEIQIIYENIKHSTFNELSTSHKVSIDDTKLFNDFSKQLYKCSVNIDRRFKTKFFSNQK